MTLAKDPYRGHIPRSFIYIGGKLVLCEEYNLTINNKGEAAICNVSVPLENIDSSVFAETDTFGNLFPIEVWSGYVEDLKNVDEQISLLRKQIEENKPQAYLTKRFDGYVMQPSWRFGFKNTVSLSCIDWTGILRDMKFAARVEDGSTEARAIVNMVKKQVSGIDIVLDNYKGSIKLGTADNKDGKYVYNATGKTLFEVLVDVANRTGKMIIAEGKTIKITTPTTDPNVWQLYYGNRQNLKRNGLAIGQYFQNMEIRYGQKGRPGNSNLIVVVTGVNEKKKGEDKKVLEYYPEDAKISSTSDIVRLDVHTNINSAEAKAIAENKYRVLTKRSITGTVDLPFANNFLMLQDAIEFVPDDDAIDMHFLKGYWFTVNSIEERYSSEGYSQSIEFEADPLLANSPVKRIAPKGKK